MADFLLDLGQNPTARNLIKRLGLPIPMPQKLKRSKQPWEARPLKDQKVLVAGAGGGTLPTLLADTLAQAGADAFADGDAWQKAFASPGEAYGRPLRPTSALDPSDGKTRLDAIVFDATTVSTVAGLRALYDAFHPRMAQLAKSAHVVVLGRANAKDPEAAAAQAALSGFVRSVAKEIGKLGSTANLILVEEGAEKRVAPVVRFLLSARSAFVTAQPILVGKKLKKDSPQKVERPFEKKVVLVTGAARGIGAATAKLFAREGAHVICLDRPEDDAATAQLAREINGTPLLVDITAPDAPEKIAAVAKDKGGLDVVIHNAGITRDKTLARMKDTLWDQAIDVNLGAVVRITAALEPLLAEHARVICLSSVAGLAGNLGQTNYAASKAGIVGYVSALAQKLAERNITVNAIAPGFIETRLTAAIPIAIREAGRRLAALGQGGQPEDIAEALGFLASPGADGITGQTLRVCGGALIGA
jgi:3-oxoacyl-[acyl-carrier protein] reductase